MQALTRKNALGIQLGLACCLLASEVSATEVLSVPVSPSNLESAITVLEAAGRFADAQQLQDLFFDPILVAVLYPNAGLPAGVRNPSWPTTGPNPWTSGWPGSQIRLDVNPPVRPAAQSLERPSENAPTQFAVEFSRDELVSLASSDDAIAVSAAQTLISSSSVVSDQPFLVSPKPDAACSGTVDPAAWPFAPEPILRQLSQTIRHPDIEYDQQTILVLDTGFNRQHVPPYWTDFTQDLIKRIPRQGSATRRADGVNLAFAGGAIAPDQNYDLGWHGLSVAEIALGSRNFHDFRSLTNLLPSVGMANAMHNGRIQASSLINAYDYASRHDIAVINMSFLLGQSPSGFLEVLSRHGNNVLLVVAAGNDGEDLDKVGQWPASMGGESSPAAIGSVVTVGSHDPDGSISSFSRRGDRTIDLLAPGCGITTVDGPIQADNPETLAVRSVSGTSFAAPSVSFVAAMLHGLGLPFGDIKDRLTLSADVSNALDSNVHSRGRLNPEDALAFPFIVHRFDDDGSPSRVTAEPLDVFPNLSIQVTLCGEPYLLHELSKIARRVEDDGTAMLHVWERPLAGTTLSRGEYCQQQPGDTMAGTHIRDATTGQEMAVELDSLQDLILSMR